MGHIELLSIMRILHLLPKLSGGGAERQLSYLAPELVKLGHCVHVAYLTNGPANPELHGVQLHQLKAKNNYDPYLLWQIQKIINQIRPDIIHTWILQMDIIGGIMAKFNRIPWIFREPSSAMAYSGTIKQRLRVWIGSSARAIVSNSQGGDSYWKIQLPQKCRYIIPNGIPINEIDGCITGVPIEFPNLFAPIVLYVGRLSSTKNLKSLLEVLAIVKSQRTLTGVLCGEGPERIELEVTRQRLGLDKDILFTGHLKPDMVWSLMKRASVFISLSAFEGCPNTIMEAMVCNCPLIVSDIPAHREILDESSSLFVDPLNIHETAKIMINLLDHLATARRRAEVAKQRTFEWSVSHMTKKYESLYKEIIVKEDRGVSKRQSMKNKKKNIS